MRGRYLFRLFYPFLYGCSLLLYLFPRFIINWLWILSDLFPGIIGVGFRYIMALRLCKEIGKNVFFGRCVEIKNWENMKIGSNVSIHKDCYIDAFGGLDIGDDVSIAHSSSILSSDHTWDDINKPIRSNPLKKNPVKINNDVWIGCGARILSGVSIGNRCVVAAGAVVIKNIEPNCLVAGIPAKFIKSL